MKSEPLLLSAIHFIPKSEISSEMLNADIIQLATEGNEMYYTPGSAAYTDEFKNSTSGGSWQIEFGFSFPGLITEEKSDKIINTGAIVLFTVTDRIIVVHKNDVFSNTALKPEIQSNTVKTIVKYALNSLVPL